mmetsp:Transcript_31038/g.99563  ORF Transcript_31038/g.99563 Transcript_31038/m.99563 type:complete len:216 (+) Transcript_31038:1-648(+)
MASTENHFLQEMEEEIEGVRNRISFLSQPHGYQSLDEEGRKSRSSVAYHELPDTPFDSLFLTAYFLQIYIGQFILQVIVVIWSFTLEGDIEPKVLLSLDCFAVALLVVEVSSGLISKGWRFFDDLGGKIDFAIVVISLLAIGLYFGFTADKDQDMWRSGKLEDRSSEVGLTFSHSLKLIRDLIRFIRLPLFFRNVAAVWRYHQALQRREKERNAR